ncbi:MAG TPA: hypothetical protein VLW50_32655 [Streptosporangiaceae bacterium]|nr:hypothetical protein [Streptosporangiaceae bacterium]
MGHRQHANGDAEGGDHLATATLTWRAASPRDQDARLRCHLATADIRVTGLKLRAEGQARDRAAVGDVWQVSPLVFTTTLGTPYEPRNFARHFALRCENASVR